ncbi:phage tail-collar fiber domain-containing protein [Xenorhabdus szentirmaii]|uniref:phage tail-collar fiber domain-containing protein n=1 Tax=Xenorhabdus szentirmaii TaxID=290112 RepID=UPI001998CDA1|nr:phage tail protein [Xenorhabdus sp. 5]MBD2824363.1 phage tail protein [Xenorhabdus sp. 5]
MSTKYFALLTQLGADKLANAAALGTKLAITQMAVGDGGGVLPTPDTTQTKLVNERRRATINTLNVDPKNAHQIIAEQVIPESEGGWWIREIGLFDQDGVLIAVGNCPETYKPQLQEGSGRTQTIRMVLIVSHTDAVTLKIDPSVVLATREYTDTAVKKAIDDHEKSRRHPDATLKEKGLVILSSAVDSNSEMQAATPKAVKAVHDLASVANDNANTRLEKAKNGTDIPDKAAFVNNLGLRNTVNQAQNAVPNSRKINDKPLAGDITLNADDVQAYPRGTKRDSLPGDHYHGPFSCGQTAGWAKGISVGIGSDTGQIWIDEGATLHTRFLNSNSSVAQQRIVSIPIGATLEWQSEAMIPEGFLENNGREFDKSRYPELLKVFPDGRLPDDRGLFKRGLDTEVNGVSRGFDKGRKLGIIQGDAIRNITGSFGTPTTEFGLSSNYGEGAFEAKVTKFGRQAGSGGDSVSYTFDASRVVPTAEENRPINKAVIYITRAF